MTPGNMLIAQSGGPSMVINQSLVGAVLAARDTAKIGKIYGALHGIQGILDERFIDLRKPSRKTLEAVAATPSSALGSVRRKPTAEDCAAIFRVLHARDIRYFFYIGGNDSAEPAAPVTASPVSTFPRRSTTTCAKTTTRPASARPPASSPRRSWATTSTTAPWAG
jgi:6-phosphofructokinase 1